MPKLRQVLCVFSWRIWRRALRMKKAMRRCDAFEHDCASARATSVLPVPASEAVGSSREEVMRGGDEEGEEGRI